MRARTPSKPALSFVGAALLNLAVVYIVIRERPLYFEALFVWAGAVSAIQSWAAGRLLESRASFVPALAVVLGIIQPLLFVSVQAGDGTVALSTAAALACIAGTWAARAAFAWRP